MTSNRCIALVNGETLFAHPVRPENKTYPETYFSDRNIVLLHIDEISPDGKEIKAHISFIKEGTMLSQTTLKPLLEDETFEPFTHETDSLRCVVYLGVKCFFRNPIVVLDNGTHLMVSDNVSDLVRAIDKMNSINPLAHADEN